MFKCDEPCHICPECGYWYYGQESIPVLVQRRDESFMNDPRIRVRPNVDRDPLIVEQQRIRKKKSMLGSFVDGLSGHWSSGYGMRWALKPDSNYLSSTIYLNCIEVICHASACYVHYYWETFHSVMVAKELHTSRLFTPKYARYSRLCKFLILEEQERHRKDKSQLRMEGRKERHPCQN